MVANKNMVSIEEVGKNKREEILDEASKLFKKKGFNGTSMQDIANEVGILKGSIYYYFNSKNEIFREVLNKGISPVLKHAEFIMSKKLSSREKLRELIQNHIRYIMGNNFSLVIYFQEKEKISAKETTKYVESRNSYEKFFRDVLDEGIRKGDFPEVNISLTVFAILGMCNWIIQWYNPKGPQSPGEITDHMIYLICDLMLNPNKEVKDLT
ncbi:MAG: TetR/AcrR family transcriptional regulator [Dethiobacter sp.]|jgi:AcrR family transcriptional regulator|nr:MAG: TetR/AcrR family transcriptional regulator [Dethiobacter sp.]